ncbi:MAG: hypothetical protein GXO94_01755 [Nitrospirae bacterium]|nr:hypothetical protein [Nitrospirota bacterium]
MRRSLLLFLLAFVLFSGCTKAIKYTYEEIKDYPPEIQENIKKAAVVTGMTLQQVRYAWGAPTVVKVLKPTPDGKDRVQWEYHRWGGAFKTILRFTDGRLTEIVSTEPGIAK